MKRYIYEAVMHVMSADIPDKDIDFNQDCINSDFKIYPTFDELNDIFENNPDDIFLSLYNTSYCVKIVCEDFSEHMLSEYNDRLDGMFLKIIYGRNRYFYFPIYPVLVYDIQNWSDDDAQFSDCIYIHSEDAVKDMDGLRNTKKIIEEANRKNIDLKTIRAMYACLTIKSKAMVEGFYPYMPSLGQMYFIHRYIKLLNYLTQKLGGSPITIKNDKWWTSTEGNNDGNPVSGTCLAWSLGRNGEINSVPKINYYCMCFPLFSREKLI